MNEAAEMGGHHEIGAKVTDDNFRNGFCVTEMTVKTAHDAVAIRGDEGQAHTQCRLTERLKGLHQDPAGDLGTLTEFNGGCQDDVSRLSDGLGKKLVIFCIVGLGKQDVKDDEASLRSFQFADDLGVIAAWPGPGSLEILKRMLVNADDEDLRRWRGVRAQAVAEVQTMVFQGLSDPEEAHDRQRRKDQQGESAYP